MSDPSTLWKRFESRIRGFVPCPFPSLESESQSQKASLSQHDFKKIIKPSPTSIFEVRGES